MGSGSARNSIRALLLGLTFGSVVAAQPMSRRAATIPALKAFPAFYNGQSVLLRAELRLEGQRGSLAAGEDRYPPSSAAT